MSHSFIESDLSAITSTSEGAILLNLVQKSELNRANLKAPQDGKQEAEKERTISAVSEAAEERDDKSCGAARLSLSTEEQPLLLGGGGIKSPPTCEQAQILSFTNPNVYSSRRTWTLLIGLLEDQN